ncbi:MAG TPA: D-2-hydroxyacid dehydrogenase [Steroidobacteraceae bacterium]|nr:D-2-hydroxyacid dehydrogenase [Steroidobacteraceae bacterium]
MSNRIVFLDRASVAATVRQPRCEATYIEYAATVTDQIVTRLQGATVAITNKVPLRVDILRQLPELKLIAVVATGYDVVDIPYCNAHGVAVANIRNYAVHSVPEHAFSMILALRRNLLAYREDVLSGVWQQSKQFCFFGHDILDLHGATLGIIGEGAIGQSMDALGRAFGMRPIYAAHEDQLDVPGQFVALPELLGVADVVSLHCPLTPATRNLIGSAQLRNMKPSALLINTARGGLVDEQALIRALDEGWVAGAGFDVLTVEPPAGGHPLLELRRPNFILTPHVAWASTGAMQILADQLMDNIEAWVAGRPQNLVTTG